MYGILAFEILVFGILAFEILIFRILVFVILVIRDSGRFEILAFRDFEPFRILIHSRFCLFGILPGININTSTTFLTYKFCKVKVSVLCFFGIFIKKIRLHLHYVLFC